MLAELVPVWCSAQRARRAGMRWYGPRDGGPRSRHAMRVSEVSLAGHGGTADLGGGGEKENGGRCFVLVEVVLVAVLVVWQDGVGGHACAQRARHTGVQGVGMAP